MNLKARAQQKYQRVLRGSRGQHLRGKGDQGVIADKRKCRFYSVIRTFWSMMNKFLKISENWYFWFAVSFGFKIREVDKL
jgi:hypothetical protein